MPKNSYKLSRPAAILAVVLENACMLLFIPTGVSLAQPIIGSLVERLALKVAARSLNPYLEANQPVIRDWDTIFPQVDTLPGPPFRPIGIPEAQLSQLLADSGYRTIALKPGDYQIPLQLYCMHFSGGSGPGLTFALGSFRGTRAAMISTLIGRGSMRHIPHQRVQVLAWGLQAGLPYERLDRGSQALFNQLIPEYRDALGPGFLEGLEQYWNSLARTIPHLPPFDVAVDKLGLASAVIQDYQRSQRTLEQYAGDYQQLSQHLFLVEQGTRSAIKPWSIVAPGVYERMIGDKGAMGPGTLQVRVVPRGAHARLGAQSVFSPAFLPGPDAGTLDETVAVPLGNVMGYPNLKNGQTPLGGIVSLNNPGVLIELETLGKQLNAVQNVLVNLMWVDCAPQSAASAIAYVLEPLLPSQASQGVGLEANASDLSSAILAAMQNGGAIDIVNLEAAGFEMVAFQELQKQGISCSNYNLAQAIVEAASHSNATSPFTSASIIPGSVSFSPGEIAAQIASHGTETAPVSVRLRFVACGKNSSCQGQSGQLEPTGGQRSRTASASEGPSAVTVAVAPAKVLPNARCTVSGVLSDAGGNPVPSKTVQLSISAGGISIPISVTTGNDGKYSATFTAPPMVGNISVTAVVGGSLPPITAETTITVVAGQP
jgi:Invasin, domain 3